MGGFDVGETSKVKVMGDENIHQMFLNMQWMLGELYENKKARDAASSSKAMMKEKGKGKQDKPPPAPSSSSSSSSSSSLDSQTEKKPQKSTLLKLDVKFELPVYDDEMNLENLDNSIKQLEVYYIIQKFFYERTKIQLATLRMGEKILFGGKVKLKQI